MSRVSPSDRIRSRMVSNNMKLIHEHLEAMQRDAHGMEYDPWKREVDSLWKRTFEQINQMNSGPQKNALEMIREPWVLYITHYGVMDGAS